MPSKWFAVVVNPNCERRALAGLAAAEIHAFWPTVIRWTTHARKRRVSQRGLFSRYLFVNLDPNDGLGFAALRGINGVEGVVRLGGVAMPIPDLVIDRLMDDEDAGLHDETRPKSKAELPAPGTEVRIKGGPFADYAAVVDKATSDKSVRVMLKMILGGDVAATVALDKLEVV